MDIPVLNISLQLVKVVIMQMSLQSMLVNLLLHPHSTSVVDISLQLAS